MNAIIRRFATSLLLSGSLAIIATPALAEQNVISKILTKNEDYTITELTFTQDQALAEHHVATQAVIIVLEGTLTLTLNGHPTIASAGDVITIPPDMPHAINVPTAAKMLLVKLNNITAK